MNGKVSERVFQKRDSPWLGVHLHGNMKGRVGDVSRLGVHSHAIVRRKVSEIGVVLR